MKLKNKIRINRQTARDLYNNNKESLNKLTIVLLKASHTVEFVATQTGLPVEQIRRLQQSL